MNFLSKKICDIVKLLENPDSFIYQVNMRNLLMASEKNRWYGKNDEDWTISRQASKSVMTRI